MSLASVEDVRQALAALVGETLALSNSVKRNRAAGYLLGLLLRALEVGDLEERVAALEARMEHD